MGNPRGRFKRRFDTLTRKAVLSLIASFRYVSTIELSNHTVSLSRFSFGSFGFFFLENFFFSSQLKVSCKSKWNSDKRKAHELGMARTRFSGQWGQNPYNPTPSVPERITLTAMRAAILQLPTLTNNLQTAAGLWYNGGSR